MSQPKRAFTLLSKKPDLGKAVKSNGNIQYYSLSQFEVAKPSEEAAADIKEEVRCKHAELISYKVHKDQFKSLLVPPPASKSKGIKIKEFDLNLAEPGSPSSPNQGDGNSSDCLSTEGEEESESAHHSDSQYLTQASNLREALINSKALVGDYVELKNCKRCGSMMFKDNSSAIKDEAQKFNADISPAQLLTKMFHDETKYKFDHFVRADQAENLVARQYVEVRENLVKRIFEMGAKFKQRQKTLHIAVEVMDRFFLDQRTQSDKDLSCLSSQAANIIMATSFLIASKYDEIDDHLVFINDVQKYYQRNLQAVQLMPSWTDIVETERMLMNFFGWDLGFVLPIHYVEIFLANGVLFESETHSSKTAASAGKVAKKCYELLDKLIFPGASMKNQGFTGNQLASMIVYASRKEVLGLSRAKQIWPKELQLISRMTEKQAKKLESIFRRYQNCRSSCADEGVHGHLNNEFSSTYGQSKYLDLTTKAYDTAGLVSPKANSSIHFHQEGPGEEQLDDSVPVPQIISKGKEHSIQDYYLKDSSSGVKKMLERAKDMPFRMKKLSLVKPKDMSNQKVAGKAAAIPTSSSKQPSMGAKHFISAQKSEDGRLKLFAERRTSGNAGGVSSKKFQEQGLSLRQPMAVKSGSKLSSAGSSFNQTLAMQKSHKTIKTVSQSGPISGLSSGGLRNGHSRQAIPCMSTNLKISSARQDIVSSTTGSIPHTTKSTLTSGSIGGHKSKLSSKYGIATQSNMIANGTLKVGSSHTANLKSHQTIANLKSGGNQGSQSSLFWKRSAASSKMGNSSGKQPLSSNKKKFGNPYSYNRTNTSKDLKAYQDEHFISQQIVDRGLKNPSAIVSLKAARPLKVRDNSETSALMQRDFRRGGLRESSAGANVRSTDSKMRNSLHAINYQTKIMQLERQRQASTSDLRMNYRSQNPSVGTGLRSKLASHNSSTKLKDDYTKMYKPSGSSMSGGLYA